MKDNNQKVYQLNAIKLAYMGDSVFTTYIRRYFILNTDNKNSQLNKIVNQIVCAVNQAKIMEKICGNLNETEQEIANRAKNLHFNNIAKNSTPEQYTKATEFEAVLGYWYLTEQYDKIEQVVNISLEMYYDSGRN